MNFLEIEKFKGEVSAFLQQRLGESSPIFHDVREFFDEFFASNAFSDAAEKLDAETLRQRLHRFTEEAVNRAQKSSEDVRQTLDNFFGEVFSNSASEALNQLPKLGFLHEVKTTFGASVPLSQKLLTGALATVSAAVAVKSVASAWNAGTTDKATGKFTRNWTSTVTNSLWAGLFGVISYSTLVSGANQQNSSQGPNI